MLDVIICHNFTCSDQVPRILDPPQKQLGCWGPHVSSSGVCFLSRKHPFVIWVLEVLLEWLVPGHISGLQFWGASSWYQNQVGVKFATDQLLYFLSGVAPLSVVSAPDSVEVHHSAVLTCPALPSATHVDEHAWWDILLWWRSHSRQQDKDRQLCPIS